MPVGVGMPLRLEPGPDDRVGIRVSLQTHKQVIDELRLAGGIDPLPADLPGAERGTDQDAQTGTDQDPDEEIPTSTCRQYRERVHSRSVHRDA